MIVETKIALVMLAIAIVSCLGPKHNRGVEHRMSLADSTKVEIKTLDSLALSIEMRLSK